MSSAAAPARLGSAPAPPASKAAPGTCNRSIYDLRGNPYNWNIRNKFIPLSDCEVPSVQLNEPYKFRSFLEYHSNVGGGGETLEYILIADENTEVWNNIVSLRITKSGGFMTLNAVGNEQIQQLINITYNTNIKNINSLFTRLANDATAPAAGYWDVRMAFNDALKEFFTKYFEVNNIIDIVIQRKAIRLFLADLKRNGDMVQIEILSRFQSEHPDKTFIFVTHDYRAALIANKNYNLNVVYEDTTQYLCLKLNSYIEDNSENELTSTAEVFFNDLSESTIVVGWDDKNDKYKSNKLDFIKDSVHDRFRGIGQGMPPFWDHNAFIEYFNKCPNRTIISHKNERTELGTILKYFKPSFTIGDTGPPYDIYMEADGTGRLLKIQKMDQKYLGRIKFGQGNFDGATIGAEPRIGDPFYDKGDEDVCVIPDSILHEELAVRRTALITNRKNYKSVKLQARFNAVAAPAAASAAPTAGTKRKISFSPIPINPYADARAAAMGEYTPRHTRGTNGIRSPVPPGYYASLSGKGRKTRKNNKKLRKTRRRN